ncbi:MAG: APA family basic amino acid/polyamine antiporter [Polyangiales bacterium]|jgi:APA family basic amino acid/polyamine antiporter
MTRPARSLGWMSAAQLVVASMIGTGIFTGSGYFLGDVPSAPALLIGWLLGGFLSLAGALSYGELCAALPHNGGEYALLSRIYGPRIGHAAGVISILAGFAGAIAAGAHAFGEYGLRSFGMNDDKALLVATGSLVAMGVVHMLPMRRGMVGQNAFTAVKVVLSLAVACTLIFYGDLSRIDDATIPLSDALLRPAFAGGLVYIAFAYTGWNAAAYVAGETVDAQRNVPLALVLGTLLVTALYLLFNVGFLASAPLVVLGGEADVAYIAARESLGEPAARGLSALIAFGLLSTIGAMIMTGARVLEAMGRRDSRLASLVRREPNEQPRAAVVLVVLLSLLLTLSGGLRDLIVYVGVTLSLSALMTVAGLFVLRHREPELERPYRCLGYPLTPLLFCAFSVWMIVFACIETPKAAIGGVITLVVSLVTYRAAPSHAQVSSGGSESK